MGLIDKIRKEQEIPVESVEQLVKEEVIKEQEVSQDQLLLDELELILVLIKESTFKGEFVETVYNATLKVQNQYLKQKQ